MKPHVAQEMALMLMRQHGLHDWTFELRELKSYFGFCYWHKRHIVLSRPLTELNDESHVRNTILHEIAHALTPRHERCHGKEWKRIAISIGCNGQRCYSKEVTKPISKYIGTCPTCSKKFNAHRRTTCSCPNCSGGTFCIKHLITWEERTSIVSA